MKCPTLLADLLYRAVRPAACVASPLLPEELHPGKRAYRGIRSLGVFPGDRHFTRNVLESRCHSMVLQRHVARLRSRELAQFFERRIVYEGAATISQLVDEPRPLIFATPHYGPTPVGCAAVALSMRGRKAFNVFYDKERHGARMAQFLEGAGLQSSRLLGGLAGIRTALRALARGECLAILPDAFDDIDQTLVVPFFGRLLRVASGTAFLALRSRALIVPAFAIPRRDFGLTISIGAPIDPCRIVAEDEAQALFTLTHLLFSRIEAQLRLAPKHWSYWETLPYVSTPVDALAGLDNPQLMRTLKAKFHALPEEVQDIPELEFLLE